MKKINFPLLLLLVGLIFGSCQKDEYPITDVTDIVEQSEPQITTSSFDNESSCLEEINEKHIDNDLQEEARIIYNKIVETKEEFRNYGNPIFEATFTDFDKSKEEIWNIIPFTNLTENELQSLMFFRTNEDQFIFFIFEVDAITNQSNLVFKIDSEEHEIDLVSIIEFINAFNYFLFCQETAGVRCPDIPCPTFGGNSIWDDIGDWLNGLGRKISNALDNIGGHNGQYYDGDAWIFTDPSSGDPKPTNINSTHGGGSTSQIPNYWINVLELQECLGLNEVHDIDLQSGGNINSTFPGDVQFCTMWNAYVESCLSDIGSTHASFSWGDVNQPYHIWGQFLNSNPSLFMEVIDEEHGCVPTNGVSTFVPTIQTPTIDVMAVYEEAFNAMQSLGLMTNLTFKKFTQNYEAQLEAYVEYLGNNGVKEYPEFFEWTERVSDSPFNNEINEFKADKPLNDDVLLTTSVILDLHDNNLLEGPYQESELEAIIENSFQLRPDQYDDLVLWSIILSKEWINNNPGQQCGTNCQIKIGLKAYWKVISNQVHTTLDICGLTPAGVPCDLVNGVIYTIEGDGFNAAISFAAAIPIVGWAATARRAFIAVQIAPGVVKKLKITRTLTTGGMLLKFSHNSSFRQIMNMTGSTWDNFQAHHLIPKEFWDNPVIQKAAASMDFTFHMNHPRNGVPVPTFNYNFPGGTHANHPNYNAQIQNIFTDALNMYPNATPSEWATAIQSFQQQLRNLIANNPNTRINDLDLSAIDIF